ncbi:MAG: DEAD/DEAH box helicase [Pyrinomonadaceae bacterium]
MFDLGRNFENVERIEAIIQYILAIYWEPISTTNLQKLVRTVGVRKSGGKIVTISEIKEIREELIEAGIVEYQRWGFGSGYQIADGSLKEKLVREIKDEHWFDDVVEEIKIAFPLVIPKFGYYEFENITLRLLRDYRLSIYLGQTHEMKRLFDEIVSRDFLGHLISLEGDIFGNPFQGQFLSSFDSEFQQRVLAIVILEAHSEYQPTEEIWEFVKEKQLESDSLLRNFKIEELIFRGKLAQAEKLLIDDSDYQVLNSAAVIAFLNGEFLNSVALFNSSIKLWRKEVSKRSGYPAGWEMFFYGLALYKTDEKKVHKFAKDYYRFSSKNYPEQWFHLALMAISEYLQNNDDAAELAISRIYEFDFKTAFIQLIAASIIPKIPLPEVAKPFRDKVRKLGYDWALIETLTLLNKKGESGLEEELIMLRDRLGFEPAGNTIPVSKDWERSLNLLQAISEKSKPKSKSVVSKLDSRIAWKIDVKYLYVQPVEQKYSKQRWTEGRNVSLKRMKDLKVKALSDQDIRVIQSSLNQYVGSYGRNSYYEFDWENAIDNLVDHPLLFSIGEPSQPITLIRSEPVLVIKDIGDELEITFDTEFVKKGIKVEEETETRFRVIKISTQHEEIANTFNNGSLRIPKRARERLQTIIQPLAQTITVQSDLEEHYENLPSLEADSRIYALISPTGSGFHLELFVKPFGEVPPYFKPGKGAKSVVADVGGVQTRTKRAFGKEEKSLSDVLDYCPLLLKFENANYEWNLADAEECLTVLSEFEVPRSKGNLVIEWGKDQKLKLLGSVNFDNFSFSVKQSNHWFEVDGKAKINEDLVLTFRELSKFLRGTETNFIELSDGQFIAITEKLRKHLQSLNAVVDSKNRLHKLNSGIIEDFAYELKDFKTDKGWKAHIKKIRSAEEFVPEVPSVFQAELRPYQKEGFEWLSRLANWGVGACLADDMGLGKTIQALALLVERAEKGSGLIVAPVSVTRNWVREARRFAPTLNFQIFGEDDRKKQVESLGKYDVLVVSYNLLQIEEELFTKNKFATIILDEAQAIKNRNTKRSKTVMNLQGDFRLITTGTPIENHLGELWNLFNFINPGLLGSHDFFNEKFAIPIEKYEDTVARKTLQRLIKPFVLRRRKNQVLDDLPEKTEIVLTVEMSTEQRAFYEATRREALEKIEAQEGGANDKRFRILAELTKLRLACCHPKLVNDKINLGSSKLELFGEILSELLENRHKALVFSQFVKHLAIIEEYLKSKGIKYHYLDGSTSAKIRQQRIDAFQRGDGEVFLISLKAGGTGLNLTAADYAIHLDPWWNPAVEDQASARVHRIGQKRPVTVYRLVTEDTVEEKIVKMHETKRDLADSLLEGTDTSGKISADELLKLISET